MFLFSRKANTKSGITIDSCIVFGHSGLGCFHSTARKGSLRKIEPLFRCVIRKTVSGVGLFLFILLHYFSADCQFY